MVGVTDWPTTPQAVRRLPRVFWVSRRGHLFDECCR